MALDIVIMAAGKGTRMKSRWPKVLHRLAGRTLLQHVLDTAASLGEARTIVITGHGEPMRGPEMRAALHALARDFDRVAVPKQGIYLKEPARAEDGSAYRR